MAEFPALPLWTDAYLADTTHLSDAEHGRYMLMLIQMWRAPRQRFPNDDEWLARKFGRSSEVFVSEWKPIMQEFMQNDSNWWTQKKLAKEFAYVQTLSAKRSVAAKSRWQKEKGVCNSNAPTPTPTPTLKRKKEAPALAGFDLFWNECPKKVGRGEAERAWLKALTETSADVLTAAMRAYGATQTGKTGSDRHFIKTPGPWLNGKHWLDEGIAPAGPALTPEQIAINIDRADKLFHRGKYAED